MVRQLRESCPDPRACALRELEYLDQMVEIIAGRWRDDDACHDQNSSSGSPLPDRISCNPCCARSNAPGIESSRSTIVDESGSASSRAALSSDPASVTGIR